MPEFVCAHLECEAHLTAPDKGFLMQQVAEHLKSEHNVATPTETLMTYLETTCVTNSTSRTNQAR